MAAVKRAIRIIRFSGPSPRENQTAAAVGNSGIAGLMDAVLSVEDVRIYKPHPSVYSLAAQRLGLEREQMSSTRGGPVSLVF